MRRAVSLVSVVGLIILVSIGSVSACSSTWIQYSSMWIPGLWQIEGSASNGYHITGNGTGSFRLCINDSNRGFPVQLNPGDYVAMVGSRYPFVVFNDGFSYFRIKQIGQIGFGTGPTWTGIVGLIAADGNEDFILNKDFNHLYKAVYVNHSRSGHYYSQDVTVHCGGSAVRLGHGGLTPPVVRMEYGFDTLEYTGQYDDGSYHSHYTRACDMGDIKKHGFVPFVLLYHNIGQKFNTTDPCIDLQFFDADSELTFENSFYLRRENNLTPGVDCQVDHKVVVSSGAGFYRDKIVNVSGSGISDRNIYWPACTYRSDYGHWASHVVEATCEDGSVGYGLVDVHTYNDPALTEIVLYDEDPVDPEDPETVICHGKRFEISSIHAENPFIPPSLRRGLSGIDVALFPRDSPSQPITCRTDSLGRCCIQAARTGVDYFLGVQDPLGYYDTYVLPLGLVGYQMYNLDLSYFGPLGDTLEIGLGVSSKTYCRTDIPGFKKVCYYDRVKVPSGQNNFFNDFWMNELKTGYEFPAVRMNPQTSGRGVLAINPIYCADGMYYEYPAQNNWDIFRLDHVDDTAYLAQWENMIPVEYPPVCNLFPDGYLCYEGTLSDIDTRVVCYREYDSIGPTRPDSVDHFESIVYYRTLFDSSGQKKIYSPNIGYRFSGSSYNFGSYTLKECYKDTDCAEYGGGGVTATCNTNTNTCDVPFAILNYDSRFRYDKPLMRLEYTVPKICKSGQGSGCVYYGYDEFRYKVERRYPGESWIQIDASLLSGNPSSNYRVWIEDDLRTDSDCNAGPIECGQKYVGVDVQYRISAYVYSGGSWIQVSTTPTNVVTFAACDDSSLTLRCSSMQCSETEGYCDGITCVDKVCSSDNDCFGCYMDNNEIDSEMFCYKTPGNTEGLCKPKYKGCYLNSHCQGGTANGIWYSTNPQFCNIRLNIVSVSHTELNKGVFQIDWMDYTTGVCTDKLPNAATCTDADECIGGICRGGGILNDPVPCKFPQWRVPDDLNFIPDYPSHTDDCHNDDLNRLGYCYTHSPAIGSNIYDEFGHNGICYKFGTCTDISSYVCGGPEDDDFCEILFGAGAFCHEVDLECLAPTERYQCGEQCMRDAWCDDTYMEDLSCVKASGESYGLCLPPSGQCIPTSTTLPHVQCDYTKCVQSSTFVNKVEDGVTITCIDGQGCPAKDPVTGEYLKYSDGSFKYDGCGCGEGFACFENPSVPNTGLCYSLVSNGQRCDMSVAGKKGDVICSSFNCMGDSFSMAGNIPYCRSRTTQCLHNAVPDTPAGAVYDPELYCHCEPTQHGVSIGGPDSDYPPCAQIYGLSLDDAIGSVKNNYKWCYSEVISQGVPDLKIHPDYRCYLKYSSGAVCTKDYQCVSNLCVNSRCASSSNNKGLGDPCVIRNVASNADVRWNTHSNNEYNTIYWFDDCSDFTSDGELYCEPCDHTTGLMYATGSSCSSASVTHLSTGRCALVQKNEGNWCYSHSQCDSTLQQLSGGYQSLRCGTTGNYPIACASGNKFCIQGSSSTYNKHCVYSDMDGCIHDDVPPFNVFNKKIDDTCYVQQHISKSVQSEFDLFCNDRHMCRHSNTGETKFCELFTEGELQYMTHVTGKCDPNFCAAGEGSFLSVDCWRAPGFTGHHVAYAGSNTDLDMSLVYCDGTAGKPGSVSEGGICLWRKERGKSCTIGQDDECMPGLGCIGGVCKQKQCHSNNDCQYNEECIAGVCVLKPSYGVVVTADNGLKKSPNSPFPLEYDFVVSCDKKDYAFTYTSDVSTKMKYQIDYGLGGTKNKWFGDSANIQTTKLSADIPELCDFDLIGGTGNLPYKLVHVNFIPVVAGVSEVFLGVRKSVLVLSEFLSVENIRCNDRYDDPACNFVGTSRDSYVIRGTNSDTRSISCAASSSAGIEYDKYLYPRTSLDHFPVSMYARIEDWSENKYYRCEDQYGTVVEGTVLTNPAEWLFGLQFDAKTQLFLILVVLLGVPTLVLAATRKR